jgi:hypothetical protein
MTLARSVRLTRRPIAAAALTNGALMILGPVSSAKGKMEPLIAILLVGFMTFGLVRAWISYLNKEDRAARPLSGMLWVAAVWAIVIAIGIWSLIR